MPLSGFFPSSTPTTSIPVSGRLLSITGACWTQSFSGIFPSFQHLNHVRPPIYLDKPDIIEDTDRIPKAMLSQFTVNGQNIQLKQSDYKASGGEGIVYVKGRHAYKIYHDPKKMIPVGKIQELKAIGLPNVLAPSDIIYSGSEPVGFVMPYVMDTEFLCKLFTKGFRDRNNITPTTINNLVREMQGTLGLIHSKKVLVVDYNENNFLVSPDWKTVYNIDVDSYKTPSYPATAIMESIRDRKVKNNQWSEVSDWFSFGILAFQLYVGCHPYKGRNPDYAPKDWIKMMDDGVSVFHAKSKLPPATQPLSVIPKGHLKWFEAVFEKGERIPPPAPDQVQVISPAVKTQIISGNDKFDITVIRKYDSQIQALRYINGICYAITQNKIYADGTELVSFAREAGYVASRTVKDLVNIQGDFPAVIELNRIEGKLRYKTVKNVAIGEIDSKGFFALNNCIYSVLRDSLVEVCIVNRGVKITAMQQTVANVYHNHQIFDGLVVQHMLGTSRVSIPYKAGACSTIHVPELEGYRLIDGKFASNIAILIGEKNGQYDRLTFVFDKECKAYTLRKQIDVDLADINFIVKDNGICVAEQDEQLEVFANNDKVKVFVSPLNDHEQLIGFKNDTFVINGDTLHKIAAK